MYLAKFVLTAYGFQKPRNACQHSSGVVSAINSLTHSQNPAFHTLLRLTVTGKSFDQVLSSSGRRAVLARRSYYVLYYSNTTTLDEEW